MRAGQFHFSTMNSIIYPRSPRETMDGWSYLPRYIDKIRLHLAGKLHADYQENLGKGFDGMWLKYAGVKHEQMIEVVKNSVTDGEVCDWMRRTCQAARRPTTRKPWRGSSCARNSPASPTVTISRRLWITLTRTKNAFSPSVKIVNAK
jgi:hypothetical protein